MFLETWKMYATVQTFKRFLLLSADFEKKSMWCDNTRPTYYTGDVRAALLVAMDHYNERFGDNNELSAFVDRLKKQLDEPLVETIRYYLFQQIGFRKYVQSKKEEYKPKMEPYISQFKNAVRHYKSKGSMSLIHLDKVVLNGPYPESLLDADYEFLENLLKLYCDCTDEEILDFLGTENEYPQQELDDYKIIVTK